MKLQDDYIATFSPGQEGLAHLSLENNGYASVFVWRVWLHFDWQSDLAYYKDLDPLTIQPGQRKVVGPIPFKVMENVTGTRKYKLGIEVAEQWSGQWQTREIAWTDDLSFEVEPYPTYVGFVSCSNDPRDERVVDSIKSKIKEWGFKTVTVGQEVKAEGDWAPTIREEAKKADCMIGIASPRVLDAITNAWETLPWLHGETGITYGGDKPILILRDRSVQLGGLVARMPWQMEYDSEKLGELFAKLDLVMPAFREWIAEKKASHFLNTLLKLSLAIGGAATLAKIAYEVGKEATKERQNLARH